MSKEKWQKALEKYDALVDRISHIERKGKSMPYTSSNGYMFSLLNKEGEFGIRFSKEVQQKYMKELGGDYLRSHGAVMQGYVKMPERMWEDMDSLEELLKESYAYVNTLEPK